MISRTQVTRLSVGVINRNAPLTVDAVVGCWRWRRRRRVKEILIRARALLLLVGHVSVIPGMDIL